MLATQRRDVRQPEEAEQRLAGRLGQLDVTVRAAADMDVDRVVALGIIDQFGPSGPSPLLVGRNAPLANPRRPA